MWLFKKIRAFRAKYTLLGLSFFFTLLLLALQPHAHQKKTPPPKPAPPQNTSAPAKEQTTQILSKLLQGDDDFLREHPPAYFAAFAKKQAPQITLLTCSDSRVHSNLFHIDPNNYIFSVRNIGNQLLTSMGSVDYGVLHLKTPLLVIMGHTHCGAIKAALHSYSDEPYAIIQELDHLFTPLKPLFQTQASPTNLWTQGVSHNVDYQIQLSVRRYKDRIQQGKLSVIGLIDDIGNVFGKGYGRLLLTNINGETRLQALKQHSLAAACSPHLKDQHIYRPFAATPLPALAPASPRPTPPHRK